MYKNKAHPKKTKLRIDKAVDSVGGEAAWRQRQAKMSGGFKLNYSDADVALTLPIGHPMPHNSMTQGNRSESKTHRLIHQAARHTKERRFQQPLGMESVQEVLRAARRAELMRRHLPNYERERHQAREAIANAIDALQEMKYLVDPHGNFRYFVWKFQAAMRLARQVKHQFIVKRQADLNAQHQGRGVARFLHLRQSMERIRRDWPTMPGSKATPAANHIPSAKNNLTHLGFTISTATFANESPINTRVTITRSVRKLTPPDPAKGQSRGWSTNSLHLAVVITH